MDAKDQGANIEKRAGLGDIEDAPIEVAEATPPRPFVIILVKPDAQAKRPDAPTNAQN